MTSFDLVFNDHSVMPMAEDAHAVAARMRGLVDVLIDAPDHGLNGTLRIPEEFHLLRLMEDWTINDWISSPATARDEREFILRLATSSPFLANEPADLMDRASRCEVMIGQTSSMALHAAYLLDIPLVSLNHSHWSAPRLDAGVTVLDDEGEIDSDVTHLINLASVDHFTIHDQWIGNRRQRNVPNPSAVWNQRATLFPSLEFCPSVQNQLLAIPANADLFPQVVDRLFDLQRLAGLGAAFNKNAFRTKCSPTSQATFDNFGFYYTFKRSTDQTVLCGWHLYLPDGNRVYFADNAGAWIVGHVGKHLPTKLFPK